MIILYHNNNTIFIDNEKLSNLEKFESGIPEVEQINHI
jgi:hypothetical protein